MSWRHAAPRFACHPTHCELTLPHARRLMQQPPLPAPSQQQHQRPWSQPSQISWHGFRHSLPPPIPPGQSSEQPSSSLPPPPLPWHGFRHSLPPPIPPAQPPEHSSPPLPPPLDAAAAISIHQPARLSREPRMADLLEEEPAQRQAPTASGLKRSWAESAYGRQAVSPVHFPGDRLLSRQDGAQPSLTQLPPERWRADTALRPIGEPTLRPLAAAGVAGGAMWHPQAGAYPGGALRTPVALRPTSEEPRWSHQQHVQQQRDPPSPFLRPGAAAAAAPAYERNVSSTALRSTASAGSQSRHQRASPALLPGAPALQRSADADALLRALDNLEGSPHAICRAFSPT